MLDFTFYNPTKILFGKGQIAGIAQEIPQDQRILITYGGGSIKRNGVYDQVMAALAGRTVFEFAGVKIYVDATSLPLVDGTEIDFAKQGLSETFIFRNPNAAAECGCGESFTTTADAA